MCSQPSALSLSPHAQRQRGQRLASPPLSPRSVTPPALPSAGWRIRAPQTVVELPTALPPDAATAFCNHGYMLQARAGADYVLIEDGIALFRRYQPITVAVVGFIVDNPTFFNVARRVSFGASGVRESLLSVQCSSGGTFLPKYRYDASREGGGGRYVQHLPPNGETPIDSRGIPGVTLCNARS